MPAPNNDIPILVFVRGKQQIHLSGRKPIPGGFAWSVTVDDTSVAHVDLQPDEVGPLPVVSWSLTITGLKIGTTKIHLQESQATYPPNVRHAFTVDLTVSGLL